MGSGALKHYDPIRISAETKDWLEPTLLSMLEEIGEGRGRVRPVPAYRRKADFGDLDFVLDSTWFGAGNPVLDFATKVARTGEPIVVRNGGVNSVGVYLDDRRLPRPGIFQVDLISAPNHEFDWTLNYLSWNDVGNLVGRIARLADFRFGHDGLYFSIRAGTRFFEDVLITMDWDKALDFLGFSHHRWRLGFEDPQEIWNFVRSSRYFTPEAFFARNQRDRYRDEKRPVYGGFVKFLEVYPPSPEEIRDVPARVDPGRRAWVFKAFPDAKERILDADARAELRRQTKDRFNSFIAMKLTGRQGPALGELMVRVRKKLVDDSDTIKGKQVEIDQAVSKMTDQQVEQLILEAHKELLDGV